MDVFAYTPSSTFVGRRSELAILRRLRSASRLLTLTGAGGSGKTRIAYELISKVPRAALAWINLAALRDPAAVAPAIERALGLPGDGSLSRRTITALGLTHGDRFVVVLDNCEHLVEAAAACAARLLAASDGVSIMATSRSPLRIEAEVVWRIPPLSVPLPAEGTVGDALRADAVRLFVERARVAQPGFIFDASTYRDVVSICRSADGLPLAIELAAARTRHMSVAALAKVMSAPLRSLAAERGSDVRHVSLRTTIEWSHSLLDATEQRVFRRLAVFVGGFTLESAAAVCTDDGSRDAGEVVQAVTSLADQSLVEFSAREDRYRMLVPVLEYALERLARSGEGALGIERAARFLARLATIDLAQGNTTIDADARLRREFANAMAVLPWLVANETASALRLLSRYAGAHWTAIPVHLSVVSGWLGQALAAWPTRDALRARCLIHRARLEREISDDAIRVANARQAVEEAREIAVELNDRSLEILARQNSANVAIGEGDPRRAIEIYDSVLPMLQPRELAMALSVRSVLKKGVGDDAGAEADIDAAFAAWNENADPGSAEPFLTRLTAADVAFRSGNAERAAAYLRDAIVFLRDGGHSQSPAPFELLAHLAATEGDDERALRLASYAERTRSETGLWPASFLALTDRSWMTEAQRRLGPRVAETRAAGRRMSEQEAISYALTGRYGGDLSRRELDVADLVADGLTDKEIGARLGLSERTAENHVQHIRQKLSLRSRAQIGAWLARRAKVS